MGTSSNEDAFSCETGNKVFQWKEKWLRRAGILKDVEERQPLG